MEIAIRLSSLFIVIYLISNGFCDIKTSEVVRGVTRNSDDDINDGVEVTNRELLAALLDRMGQLEAHDEQYQHKIYALENTIRQQNRHIAKLEEQVNILASSKAKDETDLHEAINKKKDGDSTRQTKTNPHNLSQNNTTYTIGGQAVLRARRQQYSASAFYATIDNHHLQNLGANQDVTFDKVYTNVGNAYHANLGVFVAPVPGTYVFSTTIMDVNSHDSRYYFSVNGRQAGNLFLHGTSSYLSSSSRTAVFLLKKGDEVSVRNGHVNEGVYGFEYSCFSGFLLSFDDSPGVVVG